MNVYDINMDKMLAPHNVIVRYPYYITENLFDISFWENLNKFDNYLFGTKHALSHSNLLAPTGAHVVMMVYYIYISAAAAATFSDFHSVP